MFTVLQPGIPDLGHRRMRLKPLGEPAPVGIDDTHATGITLDPGDQRFGIGAIKWCGLARIGLKRLPEIGGELGVRAKCCHAGHHITSAGDPFGEATGDNIRIFEGIDVVGTGGRIIDNEGCASLGAGFGDTHQIHRAQHRVARHFREHPAELALTNPHQGLVEGFTNGLVEINHTRTEVLLNFQAVHIGKFELQGLATLRNARESPQDRGNSRHPTRKHKGAVLTGATVAAQGPDQLSGLAVLAQLAVQIVLRLAAANDLTGKAPVGFGIIRGLGWHDQSLQTVKAGDARGRFGLALDPAMRSLNRIAGWKHIYHFTLTRDFLVSFLEESLDCRMAKETRISEAHLLDDLLPLLLIADHRAPGRQTHRTGV